MTPAPGEAATPPPQHPAYRQPGGTKVTTPSAAAGNVTPSAFQSSAPLPFPSRLFPYAAPLLLFLFPEVLLLIKIYFPFQHRTMLLL